MEMDWFKKITEKKRHFMKKMGTIKIKQKSTGKTRSKKNLVQI